VTIRQNAGFVIVFKLGQANGTSKWSEIAGLGYVRVNKGGDCFNDRKVQNFRSSSGGWRGNGGKNGLQVLSTTSAEVAAMVVLEEEISVVMEVEEDEQD
ncbi:hypothetical protein Gotur_017909, partial [Gossypium turneri]